MGAKTPEQITKPRPTVKCDVCGRKFLNMQALKSHHKFLHEKPEASRRVAFKKHVEAKPINKKVVSVNMLKRVMETPETTIILNTTEMTENAPDLAPKPSPVSKKPEFECPVCALKFPVYFTAFRHIQKNHCVDENGEKVAPNSPLLIKPIRIEICASCNNQIRSTQPHSCQNQQSIKDQYLCLGCEQVFSGLLLYQHHVKGLHANEAQNYFFPSRDEFTAWKADLQKQTNIEFIRLNRQKTKEIYHCSYQSSADTSVTELCPSTITVREYTKGVHICYYKEHHGHTVDNTPLKKYNSSSIILNAKENDDAINIDNYENRELHQQLKKMVSCIIFDASKVDSATLKELLGKAFEMTAILKHCKGVDKETPLISKSLTDTQIAKNLDSLKPSEGKRKLSPVPKETKKDVKKVKIAVPPVEKSVENGMTTRPLRRTMMSRSMSFNKELSKKNEEAPRPSAKKSMKKNEDTPQKNQKKTDETPQKVQKKIEDTSNKVQKKIEETPQKNQKKIDETPQKIQSKNEDPPQKKQKKTEEVPLKSSLKKKEEPPKQSLPTPTEEVEVKKPVEVASPIPAPRPLLQSPSSFNDSYKNFVDQNFNCKTDTSTPKPTPKPTTKKKEIMKTKIGQFKVKTSVSPKNLSPKPPPKSPKQVKIVKEVKEVPLLPKNFKVKPDIKYEVKEQENDVNILILKI